MTRAHSRLGGVTLAAALAASLAATGLPANAAAPPAAAFQAAAGDRSSSTAEKLGFQVGPKLASVQKNEVGVARGNPILGLLPDAAGSDTSYWAAVMKAKAKKRNSTSGVRKAAVTPLLVDEAEPDGVRGGNDTAANAQVIPAFGTAAGKRSAARILGTLAEIPSSGEIEIDPIPEDNGSIPLAGETELEPNTTVTTSGTIGDGPHGPEGDETGDFDFYAVRDAPSGLALTIDINTPESSDLDSAVVVWDAEGNVVDANDDSETSLDSFLTLTLPAAGDYFVSVSTYDVLPEDPFDSGSGCCFTGEPYQTGAYGVSFALSEVDTDFYAVNLRAGDVLSASGAGGAARLSVLNPVKKEVMGSAQDFSGIYPLLSPLAGGGNAVLDHVAATTGRYYLSVQGVVGDYAVTLEAYRPGTEKNKATQKIFLDFNGARVNTAIWGGPGVRQLSPLSSFLGRWGIPASQQNALINQVITTLRENLDRDFAGIGLNVQILNSRDHPDTFGQANVSRLIVGGTIAESGVETIGIAQSIDPGNFDTAESALILLDVLSGSGADYDDATLNSYLTPQSNRVRFVGTALGNVASHEAGHYLGNWHVEQFNEVLNLMDQGGNFPLLYGVGEDGVGGTADDPDVDFGPDRLNSNEGFTGEENTRARTKWALIGP